MIGDKEDGIYMDYKKLPCVSCVRGFIPTQAHLIVAMWENKTSIPLWRCYVCQISEDKLVI